MPADAFWTAAMAFNVYLTFYRKYDGQMLRRMEIPYLLVCYGIPLVVSITYIFIYNARQGRMYGNALLWCWVSSDWDVWRIATFYAPVWLTIFITFFIYIRTGRQIYRRYKQLKSLNSNTGAPDPLFITEPFSTKTTEVYVTSEFVATSLGIDAASTPRASAAVGAPMQVPAAYSVTITSDPPQRPRETEEAAKDEDSDDDDDENVRRASSSNPYSTTVQPSLSLNTTSDTSSRRPGNRLPKTIRRNRRKLAVYEANSAAWSYARCALLFFTALLITWIPSTANRVYSVVYKDEVSLGLQYASAFVLPLQGFWNGLIYIFTTRRACRELWGRGWEFFGSRTVGAGSRGGNGKAVELESDVGSKDRGAKGAAGDRNSFTMFGPRNDNMKVSLGLPEEAYERI